VNKIRTIQIVICFLLLTVGGYFGYQLYASKVIDGKHFSELEPGNVSLLGVDAGGQGYKIIVSNGIAQLVYIPKGSFEASDEAMGGDDSEATDKRHVPLKEMVESLQGDTKALSELVTKMNDDLRKYVEDIPPNPVIWKAEDIQKAINGDKKLQAKLTHDTNATMDGSPADFINPDALWNGITIDLSVPVKVSVRGVQQTLVAHVKIPYRVQFTRDVEKNIYAKVKSLTPTNEEIKGYYLEEAKVLVDKPQERESLAKALGALIDPTIVKGYAEAAEKVLGNTKVVLNEQFVRDAHKEEVPTDSGKTVYDLVLDLTDEGRDRLWQYSRHRSGTQLLLIVNGVAIAAPVVRHELAQKQVTITQMIDPDLVDDAVNTIKQASKKS
jgi:hypothetical protein